MKPCLCQYSSPCLLGRNSNNLMIINSSQEHHCCLLSPCFSVRKWILSHRLVLEREVQLKAQTFKSIMDFSSLYQVSSSSSVLVSYLQVGRKTTSFNVTFYWSFLFKYKSVIQGPNPSASPSAVPCLGRAVISWSFSAAGGMGSFLSQSELQVGESASCSDFQVVRAKFRISFS